jgi:hypothetical protein
LNIHKRALREGWDLNAADIHDEPRRGIAAGRDGGERETPDKEVGPGFFNLSGGILRERGPESKGSIDDLLAKLTSQSSGSRLSKHVDMIRMIAEEIQPAERDEEDAYKDRIVRTLRGSPREALESSTSIR